MKKSIKNTIMIGMAAILIGTSAITCSYANITQHRGMAPTGFSQSQDGSFDNRNFNGHLPDGNGSGGQNQLPNGGNNNQSVPDLGGNSGQNNNAQPPQQDDSQRQPNQSLAPADEGNNQSSGSTADSSGTALENEASELEQLNAEVPSDNTEARTMPQMNRGGSKLEAFILYAFLAIQIAVILMIFAYLIISKFNTLSFSQVFPDNRQKD